MHTVKPLECSGRRPISVVFAGGGTGGHLFPAIALGKAFSEENRESKILFVGAGRPLEREILQRAGFLHRTIAIEGIKGRGWIAKVRAILKIPGALVHSSRILAEAKADLVVAVGGYASGPVAMAAWGKGIPMVLCEQNTIPGITNRLLFPFAKRIYCSFEETRGKIDPEKKRLYGNPIRKDLLGKGSVENEKSRPFTVLVVGGSQGARAVNRAVMDALPMLTHPGQIRFVHQTGASDRKRVKTAYEQENINAEVSDFFHDMATCYSQADLVICRAGATTVAELTALGKPALFIPYPFAADNHQEFNAKALVDKGAGEMVLEKDLTGKGLASRIDRFAANPALLSAMALQSKSLGKPEAAKETVNDCYRLLDHSSALQTGHKD
jgi:UDP-N-acetylglucosamine--N-acetylmuramyl-(pentapeptide) pyrophosphoryl-undecaprenol N-acetylglucosamine transferase